MNSKTLSLASFTAAYGLVRAVLSQIKPSRCTQGRIERRGHATPIQAVKTANTEDKRILTSHVLHSQGMADSDSMVDSDKLARSFAQPTPRGAYQLKLW